MQIKSTLQSHGFEVVHTSVISEPKPLQSDATNQQKKESKASLKLYKKFNGFAVTLSSTTMKSGGNVNFKGY